MRDDQWCTRKSNKDSDLEFMFRVIHTLERRVCSEMMIQREGAETHKMLD